MPAACPERELRNESAARSTFVQPAPDPSVYVLPFQVEVDADRIIAQGVRTELRSEPGLVLLDCLQIQAAGSEPALKALGLPEVEPDRIFTPASAIRPNEGLELHGRLLAVRITEDLTQDPRCCRPRPPSGVARRSRRRSRGSC